MNKCEFFVAKEQENVNAYPTKWSPYGPQTFNEDSPELLIDEDYYENEIPKYVNDVELNDSPEIVVDDSISDIDLPEYINDVELNDSPEIVIEENITDIDLPEVIIDDGLNNSPEIIIDEIIDDEPISNITPPNTEILDIDTPQEDNSEENVDFIINDSDTEVNQEPANEKISDKPPFVIND